MLLGSAQPTDPAQGKTWLNACFWIEEKLSCWQEHQSSLVGWDVPGERQSPLLAGALIVAEEVFTLNHFRQCGSRPP